MLSWDATGAVDRGRQLVVVGDQKQLPPSTFFDRMVNDDDDSEEADDLGCSRQSVVAFRSPRPRLRGRGLG